jgi:hypothetical protein
MPRSQLILAATLLFALGGSVACAGDFVPRATNSYASIGDDPGPRSTSCPDAGAVAAASNEADAATVHATEPSHPSAPRSARHIGVDDAAADSHPDGTATDADDKPAPVATHKSRATLRWQSLLPGVMK